MIRHNQIGGIEDGVTPEAAADQGIIPYAEVENLTRQETEEPELVGPSPDTISHWTDKTEVKTINGEQRLYAIDSEGKYFAYIVMTSENIANNMDMLHRKVADICLDAKQEQSSEKTDDNDQLPLVA